MNNINLPEHLKIVIRAVVLTLVILISYSIGYKASEWFHLPQHELSGMWCAITAIVVFDDLPETAKVLMKDRLLGTLFGTLVTTVCIVVTHHTLFSVLISLFVVSVVVIFFNMNGALKIACTTVLIIGVTAHSYSYSNSEIWVFSSMRFFESVIGGMISLLATIVTSKINGHLKLY